MQASLKNFLLILAFLALMSACAPAQVSPSAEQIQAQVASAVAMTVAAQSTLLAQAQPAATETLAATQTLIPTLTPVLPSATPLTIVPPSGGSGGGGSSTQPLYGCTFAELRPTINVFKPGDPFDILWLIKNTGSKSWPSNKDLNFMSGTRMTTTIFVSLPPLDSGETTTVSFDANAPKQPGNYEMKWKVEGGLCYPYTDIQVGKPRDP